MRLLSIIVFTVVLISNTFGQTTPTTQVKTIADLVALRIPTINNRLSALVTGRLTENDGAGGLFFYDGSAATATNLGTIFKPAATTGRWTRQYSGAVNVKWFGAVGDGATDDSVAITNALSVLNAQGGGGLYLPESTYFITNHIVVDFSNAHVYGDGTGATVIKVGAWVDGLRVSDTAYPAATNIIRNVLIENLTINGNRGAFSSPSDTYGNGLNLNAVDQALIKNVEVLNASQQGIVTTYQGPASSVAQTSMIIQSCIVSNSLPGSISIGVEGDSENVLILGNSVWGTNVVAIYAGNLSGGLVQGIRIEGNTITDVGASGIGIRLEDSALNNVVSGNFINGSAIGVRASSTAGFNVSKMVISNNSITNFISSGILTVPLATGDKSELIISNNSLRTAITSAVVGSISVGEKALVIGNMIVGDVVGISLGGTNNLVLGNYVDSVNQVSIASAGNNYIAANRTVGSITTAAGDQVYSYSAGNHSFEAPVFMFDTLTRQESSGTASDIYLNQVGVVGWYLRNTATTGDFNINDGTFDRFNISNSTGAISATSPSLTLNQSSGAISSLNLNQAGVVNWQLKNVATTGVLSFNDGFNDEFYMLPTSGEAYFQGDLIRILGKTEYYPQDLQTLAAGAAISVIRTKVRVVGDSGPVTLTSTPTIADGHTGQIVFLQGTDNTNTLTVQDQASLGGSNLVLGAATRVLGQGDMLLLMFDSNDSVWYEVSFTDN